jgi:hypothetical protein
MADDSERSAEETESEREQTIEDLDVPESLAEETKGGREPIKCASASE